MAVELRRWQRDFLGWYGQRGNGGAVSAYLHGDLGVGKTIGALAVLESLRLPMDEFFILAPKSAHPSWIDDGEKFGLEFKPNKNLFTYEKFVRLDLLPKVSFMICDEAHRLKNPTAKITARLWKYYRHTPKLLMSGTPADRLWELFSQYRLIDPMMWGGVSWTTWKKQHFFCDEMGKPRYLLHTGLKEKILRETDPHTFRVTLDDVEMPDIVPVYRRLPESRKLTKVWREFEKTIEVPLAAFGREYAIGQGIDPDTGEIIDKTKIEMMLDFLADNRKTVAFSYYQAPVRYVQARYPNDYYFVRGDYKNDVDNILRFGDKPVIATYAIAEGINLQHRYHQLLFHSLPLAFRTYYQARGRVYRSGQRHKVVAEHLLMQPIDYEVKGLVERKEEFDTYLRRRVQAGKRLL